ncbi:Guanine nucleotide exchange factor lte1 [Ophidiomyces ophidiicola]|nr:Guanine nucleotide exchange factor lte1 [Ophidiomyces ophidiicola]
MSMEVQALSFMAGTHSMVAIKSDQSSSPAPCEPAVSGPNSPRRNPARIGRFGLRRSHSVSQTQNGSKTLIPAIEETINPFNTGKKNEAIKQRLQRQLPCQDALSKSMTAAGGREGRQFTVGNVGQNGKLYLRPVPISKQGLHSLGHSQPLDHTGKGRELISSDEPRYTLGSSSQLSGLQQLVSGKDRLGNDILNSSGANSDRLVSHLSRRHSLSTIGDKSESSHPKNRGELRIVIERHDDQGCKPVDEVGTPSLTVSIPHYRLGGFRFTSGGTPVLRSSGYTQTSVSDNFRPSTLAKADELELPPLPSEMVSNYLSSFGSPLFPSPRALSSINIPSTPSSAVFYKLKEPIEPSIFDALLSIMDEPSVVRYVKGTPHVAAATPARIVAQISSDSFMDYELVSDFFLTFRSYLSHSNLLSLLLARLEWAINRPEEDGRIIRIRVFAALRHWILNYFIDDFAPNRDLRVQFCDRLNRMYSEVKSESKNSNSDLKILIDLKKCWNGRCSIYWHSHQNLDLNNPDDLVVPGGVDDGHEVDTRGLDQGGSRYQSEVILMMHQSPALPAHPIAPSAEGSDPCIPDSAGWQSVEKPASPISPGTLEPTSYSFSHATANRESPESDPARAPYQVVLPSPKISSTYIPGQLTFPSTPPCWRTPAHSHKRSGSFSDSVRDGRASLPLSSFDSQGQPLSQMPQYTENIIRGNVYGPPDPFLVSFGPPSPSLEAPPLAPEKVDPQNPPDTPKSPGPTMKNWIGTLRRALNHRPSGQHCLPRGTTANEIRGKTSALPRNVSFFPDGYGRRKAGMAFQSNTRIDLLCEDAYLSYQEFLEKSERSSRCVGQSISPSALENGTSISNKILAHSGHLKVPRRDSIPSQMTTGSKSIVIVDDTRTAAPLMTGGLQVSLVDTEYNLLHDLSLPIREGYNPSVPPVPSARAFKPTALDQLSGSFPYSNIELRRCTSYESVMTAHRPMPDHKHSSRSINPKTRSFKPSGPMLRRRRGGDLRKMQNTLEISEIQPFSSDRTETPSITGSMLQMVEPIEFNKRNEENLRVGARLQRRSLDGFHCLRRSFEATIAEFAGIPDDEDGGIESTLLKLEGRWPKRPPIHGQKGRTNRDPENGNHEPLGAMPVQPNIGVTQPNSSAGSEDSYCSIPLLERGLADESMKSPGLYDSSSNNSRFCEQKQVTSPDTELSLSIEIVEKTQSMEQYPRQLGSTKHYDAENVVLVDDEFETEDYSSELSSEISIDAIDGVEESNGHGAALSPIMSFATLGVPTHPLADPPSPPMTLGRLVPLPADLRPIGIQKAPPTPNFSPTGVVPAVDSGEPKQMRSDSSNIQNPETQPQNPPKPLTSPCHTPFILAYDSELLSHQFAIIEQAALGEIDWKDLIDMRWSHSSQTTLNWVTYLADQDRKGIDLVVARFNLMVKWAVSEIVMTMNRALRANTIIKLIHVAVHSRRLRNYATMLQITIALCSVDCTRLVKTWELVPEGEKQLLKEMESLIQPTRNFHNLRLEMETSNLQEGCIPFVGLYVQDLTYNAQKPAQIASTREGEPLVNFERYRTAAAIVKNLLRLTDASKKYRFEPVHGIIERCLWVAALTDDKIITLSKALE